MLAANAVVANMVIAIKSVFIFSSFKDFVGHSSRRIHGKNFFDEQQRKSGAENLEVSVMVKTGQTDLAKEEMNQHLNKC